MKSTLPVILQKVFYLKYVVFLTRTKPHFIFYNNFGMSYNVNRGVLFYVNWQKKMTRLGENESRIHNVH